MRAIWKGSISFGLVDVPVKLYSATEEHDVSLHQVHDADGGRIRYERRCEICGEVVSYEHIDRAYDDGNQTVVLTDEDLRSLPAERSREIEVVEFVPSEQLDPLLFDRGYYLEPDSRSPKAYVLLRQVLAESEHTAIARFTLRQRTRLAAVRVAGDVLLVQTLRWSDEIRQPEFASLDEEPRISDRELELARTVVSEMTTDFDPTEFHDDYQEELQALIEARLQQGDALDTAATFGEEEEGVAEVIDLMEALQRSVEQRRSGATGSRRTATRAAAGTSAKASTKASARSSSKAPAKASTKPAAKSSTTKSSTTKAATTKSADLRSTDTKSTTKTAKTDKTAKAAKATKTASKPAAKASSAKSSGRSAAGKTAGKTATKATAKTAASGRSGGATRRRSGGEQGEQTRDSA